MNSDTKTGDSRTDNDDELLLNNSESELCDTNDDSNKLDTLSNLNFQEALKISLSKDGTEMPGNLQSGIVLDQTYAIDPDNMNILIFGPNSKFKNALAERRNLLDYLEEPWSLNDKDMDKYKEKDVPFLTRVVTYINPASKLVKSVKATEQQMYVKVDERSYAILVLVSTPDVPYGNCFQVELLYKIMPGPQSSTNEETTRVVISWNVNFNQSTVMKHVIEGSAKQGLRESFEIFRDLLSQYATAVDSSELVLDKNQLLAPLEEEHHSDWELGMEYLCNFTVIAAISMGLYILTHIALLLSGKIKGLEFSGLDLPDTFGEMISCGVFVLLGERAFYMVSHFVKARLRRVSDHGIKAQGDGWRVTVALIEGSNLSLLASSGFSDPYVMFNCNGQTRTSSVQLETRDPLWNEILEFDAMQEPPSVLEVEVFDFDGPFDESVSLGRAEINFLKYSSTELSDLWISLDTKMTHTSDSKLHLRIFLDNTKGSDAIKEYLNKMEKEVGKKLILRSPHRNSTFQKLFSLPEDEFLINDYSCYLRRKLPIQGRLYLSARIVGFHANLFGHKTIFFFLWEDIEDIQVVSPSFSTVGSPALLFILKSGRGGDAKIGAKSKDKQGRLKFQFQAFVSFSSASRTIMGLWRTKCQNFEQNAKLEEDIDQDGSFRARDREYIKSSDGTELSKIFSTDLSVSVETMMQIFDGGKLEKKVMEEVGCLNYSTTIWEKDELTHGYRRKVHYKFNRQVSIFGGEVTSVQCKTPNLENDGWVVDEVMTIHNVPFGDHFHVNMKYVMKSTIDSGQVGSNCDIFLGVKWMKSNKFRKRITRNICNKLTHRSKEIIDLAEKELLSHTSAGCTPWC